MYKVQQPSDRRFASSSSSSSLNHSMSQYSNNLQQIKQLKHRTNTVPCNGSDNGLDRPIDDNVTYAVQKHIGKDWKDLALILGTDATRVRSLEEIFKNDGSEAIYHVLHGIETDKPTIRYLLECIKAIGRSDLVEAITSLPHSPPILMNNNTTEMRSVVNGHQHGLNHSFQRPRGILGWINEQHKIDHNLGQIRRSLMRAYRKLRMNGLRFLGYPWVNLSFEEYYVDLDFIQVIDACTQKSIQIEEIFSTKEQYQSRIVLEGCSGYGKTSLSQKICYNWSCKQTNYLCDFDIVLYVPLRQCGTSFKELLVKATAGIWTDIDTLWAVVHDPTKKIVFLLDGYDEVEHEHKQTLLPLLRGDFLPHVMVIVTTAPGCLHCQLPEVEEPVSQRIVINGFSHKEQREEFVRKCKQHPAPPMKAGDKETDEKIKEIYAEDKKMFSSPFILVVVVAFLLQCYEDVFNIRTTTDCYKLIFNFVAQRFLNLNKNGSNARRNDLFAPNAEMANELKEFGKHALEQPEKLFSSIFFRLLTYQETNELPLLDNIFDPIQKSLFEFAIAYYLWKSNLQQPPKQWQQQIKLLESKYSHVGSYVIPFLKDLMGEKTKDLLQVLGFTGDEYNKKFSFPGFSLLDLNSTPSD